MWKGKFTHGDINRTRALKNELTWYYLSHYLIGIVLAANLQALQEHSWLIILYGVLTVVFPWFWLLPSIGLGFLAKKSAKRSQILPTNLINHLNFGLGLFIWVLIFHRYFV
jgi:4-amino-4-deoxy-L-arabinose transferase-like glycosyltransferase